ncbi:MAG TPA: hypothetical protein VG816_13110 [Solirubrobacterales bacterium]|nr:hypothetical protein [Solirubrobacterales bacterium]
MRRDSEAGFTMIMTVLGTAFVLLLVTVAVAAVRGDLHLSQHDLDRKQAYEAARAGIEDYSFHLSKDSGYWAKCTNVPLPNAVNQINTPANERRERYVPGSTTEKYMIELIPAEGKTKCDANTPTESMIEHGSERQGTFRIRSTGYAGSSHVSITATFKSASFLDFVYFTELETLDPITYGFPNPSTELTAVKKQCELTYEAGRNKAPYLKIETEVENKFTHKMEKKVEEKFCVKIQFAGGDVLNGPVHTNDTMAICEEPTFGRKPSDLIEVSAKFPGWYENCSKSKPKYLGTPLTGVTPLEPPETDAKLEKIALPQFHFEGQVKICLEGSIMTVGRGATCKENVLYTGAYPSNGVIYVSNSTTEQCPPTYSPFTATYPSTSPCGNAYVHGNYSGQLTIATQNDIVIDGSLCWTAASKCSEFTKGNEMLGLIANNFVRIYHDYPSEVINPTTYDSECKTLAEGQTEGKIKDIVIDAAALSINHSIIVDHYDCGSNLGTLRINGAFSQRFRGPVGTGGGTGYLKSYNYDDRLKYQEPPSFIEPEKLPWLIGRETIS